MKSSYPRCTHRWCSDYQSINQIDCRLRYKTAGQYVKRLIADIKAHRAACPSFENNEKGRLRYKNCQDIYKAVSLLDCHGLVVSGNLPEYVIWLRFNDRLNNLIAAARAEKYDAMLSVNGCFCPTWWNKEAQSYETAFDFDQNDLRKITSAAPDQSKLSRLEAYFND